MNDEMMNLYNQLNTNEKRNELSVLLIKLDQLIDELAIKNNIDMDLPNVKNYNSVNQILQTEDEVLSFFYQDIWNLKSKILALLIKE